MTRKSTYEECERLAKELEKEAVKRKRAEEKLMKYQFMIESAHDAIFFKDLKSRYIIANDRTLRVFGLPREGVIGKNDYELLPEQEEAKKNVYDDQFVFKSGKPKEAFDQLTGPDGEKCWFEAIKVPQFDNDGKVIGLVGIARDITERKQVEKALQKAKDELEKRVEKRTRELEIKKNNLEEANIALKVLLDKRNEDKKEMEDNLLANVKEMIEPYLEKIKKTKLNAHQNTILNIVESNLKAIISPFSRKISHAYKNLTPTEIHIAKLIRHGMNSKEISELMGLAPRTIYNHRRNIRKKLGLEIKDTNLRSHLLSIN